MRGETKTSTEIGYLRFVSKAGLATSPRQNTWTRGLNDYLAWTGKMQVDPSLTIGTNTMPRASSIPVTEISESSSSALKRNRPATENAPSVPPPSLLLMTENATPSVQRVGWNSERDSQGNTVLHRLLMRRGSSENGEEHKKIVARLVRTLLRLQPNLATQENEEGLLPLHVACRHCADNIKAIEALVLVLPSALQIPIRSRKAKVLSAQLRLQARKIALASAPPPKKRMRHALPEKSESDSAVDSGCKEKTKTEDNKLVEKSEVILYSKKKGDRVLETKKFRILRPEKGYDGSYPLHLALASNAPIEVIALLLSSSWSTFPSRSPADMCTSADKFGNTPLSIALKHRLPASIVKLLLSTNPSVARLCDDKLNTPLHVACRSGCPRAVISAVVNHFPRAVHYSNFNGQTPLQLAQRSPLMSDSAMDFLSAVAFERLEERVKEMCKGGDEDGRSA